MAKRAFGGLIVALIIAGAVAWIYRSQSGPSFDLTPYNALGVGAAGETARLLGNTGEVVVITPEANDRNPSFVSELDSFQKALKKSGIVIASTVKFKLTRLEEIEAGGMVPRGQFLKALQSQAKIGAVVLFCGLPKLTAQDYDTVKQSGAKVIVVSAYQPDFPNLLKAHVIDMAIVPKLDQAAATSQKTQTLRKLFESDYMVLTPDNIANLSERQ